MWTENDTKELKTLVQKITDPVVLLKKLEELYLIEELSDEMLEIFFQRFKELSGSTLYTICNN